MKLGKIGKINIKVNKSLKEQYEELGIYSCEVCLANCQGQMFLGFAHRHKRLWYRPHLELLDSMNQTVLACVSCHTQLERDKKLTEETFMRLRGPEIL